MPATIASPWVDAFDPRGFDERSTIVVAGDDAGVVAGSFRDAGGPAAVIEADDFVVLAPEAPGGEISSWQDLPDASADAVLLRRAWSDRRGLTTAVAAASRVLARGGRVVVADVDLDRLLGGPMFRYPYRLRFASDPEAAARLRATTAASAAMATEVVRAGFGNAVALDIDEERGRFATVEEYREAVRSGAWPSLAAMTAEARERLIESIGPELRKIAPLGGLIERRPWRAVTGVKR
jgi:hypothetical protein